VSLPAVHVRSNPGHRGARCGVARSIAVIVTTADALMLAGSFAATSAIHSLGVRKVG
jgi:hypothetical protein